MLDKTEVGRAHDVHVRDRVGHIHVWLYDASPHRVNVSGACSTQPESEAVPTKAVISPGNSSTMIVASTIN
jgi:hypothetical protein